MTKPIVFDMKYYFDVRSYLDSHDNLNTPKPSVGEDARIYISSWKNRDHVVTGLKLSVAGNEGFIKSLNSHPIPSDIRSHLEDLTNGEKLK